MSTVIAEITFAAVAWVGIAAAALLVTIAGIALLRKRLAAALVGVAVVGIAIWAAHAWSVSARDAERRRLEGRIAALEAVALAPRSPLSCLGTGANETLVSACERVLFASAETVAAALSFTRAGLALMQEAQTRLPNAATKSAGSGLRATLQQDRFGFTAHALELHFGCTAQSCPALSVLPDSARVLANLREGLFERKVAAHSAAWQSAPAPAPEPPAAVSELTHVPLPSTFTLPSADSIPPVSIMDPEAGAAPSSTTPAAPARTGGSSSAAPPPRTAPADRRP